MSEQLRMTDVISKLDLNEKNGIVFSLSLTFCWFSALTLGRGHKEVKSSPRQNFENCLFAFTIWLWLLCMLCLVSAAFN